MRKVCIVIAVVLLISAFNGCKYFEAHESNGPLNPEDFKTSPYGTVEDNTYTNKYFKFQFSFDDDWTVLSRDEMSEAISSAADNSNNVQIAYAIEQTNSIVDFMAYSDTAEASLYIADFGHKISSPLNSKEQLELVAPTMVRRLASQGAENIESTIETMVFLGKEQSGLLISYDFQGEHFCTLTLYRLYQNCTLQVNLSSDTPENAKVLLEKFTKLN